MTRLAVCLITCDRPDYTKRTVESFCDHNAGSGLSRFDLMHFDDASTTPDNAEIATRFRFWSHFAKHRRGVTATIASAVHAAYVAGHSHVLILENDWESVRPFPWDLFDYFLAVPVAYTLRLTGQFKEWDDKANGGKGAGRRPFGTDHAGRGNKPVRWDALMDAPEPAEMGMIHWGNPPAVTRVKEALWLLDGTRSEKECREKSGLMEAGSDFTIRPAFNVFYHIGAERTPNFKR